MSRTLCISSAPSGTIHIHILSSTCRRTAFTPSAHPTRASLNNHPLLSASPCIGTVCFIASCRPSSHPVLLPLLPVLPHTPFSCYVKSSAGCCHYTLLYGYVSLSFSQFISRPSCRTLITTSFFTSRNLARVRPSFCSLECVHVLVQRRARTYSTIIYLALRASLCLSAY